jgi:acetyl esterase/lipase
MSPVAPLLLIAALGADVVPASLPKDLSPTNLPGMRGETYKTVGDVELKLYVREPEGHTADDARPAIVFFFGGGWKSGSPTQFYPHCVALAERGMVAITVDYRVSSRHRTTPQDAVEDAKAAIRYVRTNAERLGVDPKRIVAAGGSAGGHLAACTGLVPGFEGEETSVSSRPNALALFNPAVMLAALDDANPLGENKAAEIAQRMGGDPISISPIHHVAKGQPPTIVFHGTNDDAVPFPSIVLFAQRMRAAGNRIDLDAYPGRAHGFFNYTRGRDDYASTMRNLDAFLVRLGYLEPRTEPETRTIEVAADAKEGRPSTDVPPNVTAQLDVTYAKYGDRAMSLDLFTPKNVTGPLPTIVVVHGGGWLNGDKEKFRALALAFAERGYVTAAVGYRLAGEARFPAAVYDCNAAVRFLRANAKEFHVDPQRIGAVGGSAGGHLVGLMGTGADVAELQGDGGNAGVSSAVQSVVVMAGPMEVETGSVAEKSRLDPENSNANQWIGKSIDEAPEAYRLASPIAHVSERTPPTLFMAGELDNPSRNTAFREKLRDLGIPTGLVVVAGAKHGCWNRDPYLAPMVEAMDAWFQRTLKEPRS